MADIKIMFQCGCGYLTKSPTLAVKHSDDKKHGMTVSGEVVKNPEPKK